VLATFLFYYTNNYRLVFARGEPKEKVACGDLDVHHLRYRNEKRIIGLASGKDN
jgi:hypothetical protein